MKSFICMVLILCQFSPALASTLSSPKIEEWLIRDRPECVSNFSTIDDCRIWIFDNSWGVAREYEKNADRAYLFVLAMSMYNSLGPATNKCPEGYDAGEAGCGKQRIWYDDFAIVRQYLADRKQFETGWHRPNKAEIGAPANDWYYIFFHAFEYQTLTGPDDHATLDPKQIDLKNPTGYADIKRWMAEQATAMTNNVPPWEAVTWTTQHCAEWKGCDKLSDWSVPVTTNSTVTATASATPESAPTVAPEATQEVTTPQDTVPTAALDEPPARPMWLWLILAVAAVVGVGWVVKSLGSKGR